MEAGEDHESLEIIKELLAPADPRPTPHYALTRVDEYQVERVLQRVISTFATTAGARAVRTFADALEKVLAVRRGQEELRGGNGDAVDSCAFRPAIESHGQNDPNSERVISDLLDAVRDTATQIASADASAVPDILADYGARSPLVFRRLAMHLLSCFPTAAPRELELFLSNNTELESVPLWHERRLLEQAGFQYLSPKASEEFLKRVDAGPDTTDFQPRPGGPNVAQYVRRWKRSHLAMVAEHLPPHRRLEYEALVAEFGAPEAPDFLSYIGPSWSGPSSPQPASTLAAMSPVEFLAYTESWRPTARHDGPFSSRDGLAREMLAVIADKAAAYAEAANLFRERHPTYVRALIEGLSRSLKSGKVFAWEPVFDLCDWVLQQPLEQALSYREAAARGEDPGWGWTRKAIAELLSDGLAEGETAIPSAYLERSIQIARGLFAAVEERTSLRAPMDLALNTVTGRASYAVILYALRRAREARARGEAGDFECAAEAARLLDQQLASTSRHALGARAMIGRLLAQLIALDGEWVKRRLSILFPTGEEHRGARDAVWDAYLGRGEPTRLAFAVLRDAYEARVEDTLRADGDVDGLVSHLVRLYLSDLVDLSEGPLHRFYVLANAAKRSLILKAVGFSFFHTKEPIAPAILQRAKALWEARATAIGTVPSQDAAIECAPLGWWIASGQFGSTWELAELDRVLGFSPKLNLDYAIADKLAVIAEEYPVAAMRLIAKLSPEDGNKSRILNIRGGVKKTLSVVMNSSNVEARRIAIEYRSRLLARGHTEFADV